MHVDTGSDAVRLQAVLRDLVALSAIPAMWTGEEPPAIATGLADALVELLELDFAFVRLSGHGGTGAVDVTRGGAWPAVPGWLERHLAGSGRLRGMRVIADTGDGSEPCRGVVIPVGFNGDEGVVAAACGRGDFPTAIDKLLLSLAANHAATAFRSACLAEERRRAEEGLLHARDQLEVKVAERTAELGRLADEQASLRRVATLVARGTRPEEVFAAVTDEVRPLLSVEFAHLGRYEPDGTVSVLAASGRPDAVLRVGSRLALGGRNAVTIVRETGRPARIEGYGDGSSGHFADAARRRGIHSSVGTPILVEGRLWGVVIVGSAREQPLPRDSEARLASFTELVATAIANVEGKSELAASRRRIVAASDDARRRIERDLHDGTQQRLVSLALTVRAAEADLPPDGDDLRAKLSGIASGLSDAVAELREISRGIHPAILSEGGLGPALRALARRSATPVELDITTMARFPEPIEVAAYFVASEVLANAAKHARASRIELVLARRDRALLLSIHDDGVGAADPARGSGLVGLTDRVEALGGSIDVHSRAGEGTHITVELPIRLDLDAG